MPKFLPIILLVLVASLGLNVLLLSQKSTSPQKYLVARVIDGDTFETKDKKLIRILGISAPEIGLCGSQEAKAELERLILGKNITLAATTNDVFKRLVADVYDEKGNSINLAMIASGWAVYDSSDSAIKEEMKKAGEAARKNKIGVFSQKCSQIKNLAMPNCLIKGNFNDGRETKIYSFPGCQRYETVEVQTYQGDQWFCDENEAQKAGFLKSKNCPDKNFAN